MEDVTINFNAAHSDTREALYNYAISIEIGRFFKKFGFPMLFTMFFSYFLLMEIHNSRLLSDLGKSYSQENILCTPILIGLIFGGVGYGPGMLWMIQNVDSRLKRLPPDYFGNVTVLVSTKGISFLGQLVEQKYHWSMIDKVYRTPQYFFRRVDGKVAAWIPLNALGNSEQIQNTITDIENWRNSAKSN